MGGSPPDFVQLTHSGKRDANPFGLMVVIGRYKCLSDNGTYSSYWCQVTYQLDTLEENDTIDLRVYGYNGPYLEFLYPATSKALIQNFEMLENFVEAYGEELNDNNIHCRSNNQD